MTTVIRALSSMPSALSFVIIVLVVEAVALGAVALARRWSVRRSLPQGQPLVSAWATVAGALCGLLFAFVIATLWVQLRTTVRDVDSEATAIRMIARDLAPTQLPLLERYVRATLAEWPTLCNGGSFAVSQQALGQLQTQAQAKSAALAGDLSQQLGVLERARALRLEAGRPIIPFEVWTALIVLALAVIAVLAIANPPRLVYHVALTLIIGAELGTLFWVLTLLELPFCGKTGLTPAPILDALHSLSG